jgi:hypothetical protein
MTLAKTSPAISSPDIPYAPGALMDCRDETKYLLLPDRVSEVVEWSESRLERDPHGGSDGNYQVSSLYFDSPDLAIFRLSQAGAVDKYRVRRYGTEDVLHLECKSKRQERTVKWRATIPAVELPRVEEARRSESWVGDWYAEALRTRSLRPVCHVSYSRRAWSGCVEGEYLRVTLDQDLRCERAEGLAARPPGSGIQLLEGCVLEVKFTRSLPDAISRWTMELGIEPQRLSKYRRAVEVCGLASE